MATHYIGEIFALSAAVTWGFAVILFKKSGETVHPIGLNLFKNLLTFFLYLLTMLILGKTLFIKAPPDVYLLFLASGVLGIAISDTLFFMCLNRLGASLSAIVDCLYSPFIIGLSMLWLGEELTAVQIIGAVIIISAVLTGTSGHNGGNITRNNLILGVTFGALALAAMAVSIVMVKPLLEKSPVFWVMQVRLFGGIMFLLIGLQFHPKRKRIMESLYSAKGWKYTVSGSFVGTYLSMVFWICGMKFTLASTAAALNQTSNIFVFVFAAIFLKEAITARKTIGIILGVAGSFLVMFG
ncbi:DMT family transporter [bacterium]|nr:DMT family transporter [bacterium]